uniref:HELP domain-containing protein n=1 Tax=Mesocestoides corti TaxID=53468 RepID=A0A5K3FZB4_MESCO
RAQTCWTTWPQPLPDLSAIQWHAGKEGSQPERDMDEMQYIMSGVASVVDSDGRARVIYTGGSGCVRITRIEPQPFLFSGQHRQGPLNAS